MCPHPRTPSSDEPRRRPGPPPEKRSAAEDDLLRVLAHGPLPVADVKERLHATGVTKKTLRNAREHLRIRSLRIGETYFWELPPDLVAGALAMKEQSMIRSGN